VGEEIWGTSLEVYFCLHIKTLSLLILSLYTLILKVSYPVYKESLKVNMPPSGLAIIIGAGPNTVRSLIFFSYLQNMGSKHYFIMFEIEKYLNEVDAETGLIVVSRPRFPLCCPSRDIEATRKC
tara:strand:- start:33 stop:404 length:372 start_codon:yes stop_codon:yes gene_type:complete